MPLRFPRSQALFCVTVSCFFIASASAQEPGYNADIRPILVEACFSCHGPDSGSRRADLRLDLREAALSAGAIEPGKPESSELIRRILSNDPDEVMPPPEVKKPLTERQRQLLVEWIGRGAPYEQHWSYISPVKGTIPEVPPKREDWVRNPLDAFILARLTDVGLQPAPEAPRGTVAVLPRRLGRRRFRAIR
jgi:mono/diheme cytochrome c family protein